MTGWEGERWGRERRDIRLEDIICTLRGESIEIKSQTSPVFNPSGERLLSSGPSIRRARGYLSTRTYLQMWAPDGYTITYAKSYSTYLDKPKLIQLLQVVQSVKHHLLARLFNLSSQEHFVQDRIHLWSNKEWSLSSVSICQKKTRLELTL